MSDEYETGGFPCPEWDCGLEFNTEPELLSHLEVDHRIEFKGEGLVSDE